MKSHFLLSFNPGRWLLSAAALLLLASASNAQQAALQCTDGPEVTGQVDRWSPYAKCPKGYTVTGLAKIDLLGKHSIPTLHVNDLRCTDQGCRAWCMGSGCALRARCCTVILKQKGGQP